MPSDWPDAAAVVAVGAGDVVDVVDAVDDHCSYSQSYRFQRYCCMTTTIALIIRRQAAERPPMMMKSAMAIVVVQLEAVSGFFDRKHSMNFVHLLDPFPQRAPTFSFIFLFLLSCWRNVFFFFKCYVIVIAICLFFCIFALLFALVCLILFVFKSISTHTHTDIDWNNSKRLLSKCYSTFRCVAQSDQQKPK